MKFEIDTSRQEIVIDEDGSRREVSLYSPEGFKVLSDLWLKVGWDQKHCYTFSWMGRPIIQLPDDMIRMQEAIWTLRPDVIIETGVAHGGSLVFYASLCKAIGHGCVVGVDIEIRPHNRKALEEHDLFSFLTLIEGSSIDPKIINQVATKVKPDDTVLVILDSDHSYEHVTKELEAYSNFVTTGSYIVSTDGIMKDLTDVPRGTASWNTDNPTRAAIDFAENRQDFVIEEPARLFNESKLNFSLTHWPSAWLRKIS